MATPTINHGVPAHGYSLELEDGREIVMDVSVTRDWESVKECVSESGERIVRWQDSDGHQTKVVDVFDCETEDHLDPCAWADEDVWCWNGSYSMLLFGHF